MERNADSSKQDLARALEGAVWPLSREEVIAVARENEAARPVLTLLGGLEAGPYATRDQVLERVRANGPENRS